MTGFPATASAPSPCFTSIFLSSDGMAFNLLPPCTVGACAPVCAMGLPAAKPSDSAIAASMYRSADAAETDDECDIGNLGFEMRAMRKSDRAEEVRHGNA